VDSVTSTEPRALADGVRMNTPSTATAGIPTGANLLTPPMVTVSRGIVEVKTAV